MSGQGAKGRSVPAVSDGTGLACEGKLNRPVPLYRQIYLDYRRYRATDESWFEAIFLSQGFWATCVYRVARAVHTRIKPAWFRRCCSVPLIVIQKVMEIITGITIPTACEIGEGLYIGHFGGIIFPSRGRIGKNCNVGAGVLMGVAGHGSKRAAPTVGNRVFVGSHSILIGGISVGDDAVICAGAVVTRSVPPRAVVMGNPARVISYEGSFQDVSYDRMEEDPSRREAMAARPGADVPDRSV